MRQIYWKRKSRKSSVIILTYTALYRVQYMDKKYYTFVTWTWFLIRQVFLRQHYAINIMHLVRVWFWCFYLILCMWEKKDVVDRCLLAYSKSAHVFFLKRKDMHQPNTSYHSFSVIVWPLNLHGNTSKMFSFFFNRKVNRWALLCLLLSLKSPQIISVLENSNEQIFLSLPEDKSIQEIKKTYRKDWSWH